MVNVRFKRTSHVLVLWLLAAGLLGTALTLAFAAIVEPPSQADRVFVPLLLSNFVSGVLSLFVIGIPFCALIVSLARSRGGPRRAFWSAVRPGIGLAALNIALLGLLVGGGLEGLWGAASGDPASGRDVLRLHTFAALIVLPIVLAALGWAIERSPISSRLSVRIRSVGAAAIAVLVAVSILGQLRFLDYVGPALLGWAPVIIAAAASGLLIIPALLRE